MKHLGIILMFVVIAQSVNAQNDRKIIRQGIKAYNEGEFPDAEVQFRKAADINRESTEAEFNTGAALYEQEKYEETVKQYEQIAEQSSNPEILAKTWHNIGNSMLKSEQYGPSIEAYKNSLRLNPDDQDTKYNLAYARKKLREQEQQQQQQQQQQQDQQDQQQQEQQDQEDQQQQDQQNQQQQDQQDQEQQEQQARPLEISKEDAERMLQAIQEEEKEVKEKVDQKKAAVAKVKTEKDW